MAASLVLHSRATCEVAYRIESRENECKGAEMNELHFGGVVRRSVLHIKTILFVRYIFKYE
jgi:hypothetical protein